MSEFIDPLVVKAIGGAAAVTGLGGFVGKFLLERWLRQIDERFLAHETRLDGLDKYVSDSRTVAHDDLSRVSGELGKLTVRQERIEADLREATTDLREVTKEWRTTFETLRSTVVTLDKTVFSLEKTVTALVDVIQRQQQDKLRER